MNVLRDIYNLFKNQIWRLKNKTKQNRKAQPGELVSVIH